MNADCCIAVNCTSGCLDVNWLRRFWPLRQAVAHLERRIDLRTGRRRCGPRPERLPELPHLQQVDGEGFGSEGTLMNRCHETDKHCHVSMSKAFLVRYGTIELGAITRQQPWSSGEVDGNVHYCTQAAGRWYPDDQQGKASNTVNPSCSDSYEKGPCLYDVLHTRIRLAVGRPPAQQLTSISSSSAADAAGEGRIGVVAAAAVSPTSPSSLSLMPGHPAAAVLSMTCRRPTETPGRAA